MTGEQVRWTTEQVLALAPDAASQRAGQKLGSPGTWSETARRDATLWGLCKGSGKNPYRTAVDLTDAASVGFKCSCPSRKFPCKHGLGLLLVWAGDTDGTAVPDGGTAPEWAQSWLDGRRRREEKAADPEASAKPKDEAAARRRAERRSSRVGDGAQELARRLTDAVESGLAGSEQSGYQAWEHTAARMVDAQAPGLAARAGELGAIMGAGRGWPSAALAEMSLLHLLLRGLERVEELPPPLAATVRSRVGFTTETAAVVAAAREAGSLVRDRWLVAGSERTSDGRIWTESTWLLGRGTERWALVLGFTGPGSTSGPPMVLGAEFDAEVAFHPGAAPLRVSVAERHGTAEREGTPPEGAPVGAALAAFGAAVAADPWVDAWPAILGPVVPVPVTEAGNECSGWQLADADGGAAVPLKADDAVLWRLLALSGGGPLTVFGRLGPAGFVPGTTWDAGRAVRL
ncbi:SWIM zinc finger family protein [Streptomyces lonarensis]|uniref:SWIM zinc finger family protein n=1 Tax=Streptomyces lonarensis TaxID=700599 RepID=A0A7X6I084_9ACTN|nr:SWIM zinc finger family protein [Streptomyces lonarensis]NJQ07335.1 SWIM zinc finger family protein [Streptomyces lonarensis]